MKTIRVFEAFAGIGAPRKALTNLGIPHTSVISEIDRHAAASYMEVHGFTENLGDIRKIEKMPECDLLTYGFPCQDISHAGLQKGFSKGCGTRSGLLWEVERLLDAGPLPGVLVLENVEAITNDKFKKPLNNYIRSLSERGYVSSWKVLNAKDFGIPQNRDRFFMVSCLDGRRFQFPKGRPLDICLKDVLEKNVPQEYYLSDEQIKNYEAHKNRHDGRNNGFGWKPTDGSTVSGALLTDNTRNPRNFIVVAGNLNDPSRIEMMKRIYSDEGLAPTLHTVGGGGQEIKIIDNTSKGYQEARDGDSVILSHPKSRTKRSRVQKGMASTLMTDGNGIGVVESAPSPDTLSARPRIRKLTEREYWRLTCFSDDDFDRASKVSSKSQLYKQAANSIPVCLLEGIFNELYNKKQPKTILLSNPAEAF